MNIDGLTVARVVQPGSVEELAGILADERGTVVPVGAGTQLEFGNPLRNADCVVDLKKINRITEYVPADLTIHIEAGMTLGELRTALAANNQTLPVDPWGGDAATLGGIAATNAQGPSRATGTIRDWIIGMKVVHVDGRISKTGGRVVKNVTGYDLAKLYTGSLGTLAVIAEISLKVRANIEKTATAVASFDDLRAAAAVVSAIRRSPLQPIACEWVGPESQVWVRFGEHPRAVDRQLKNLPPGDWKVSEGEDEFSVWEAFRSRQARREGIVVKAVGLPNQSSEIIEEFRPVAWVAHALNGIVLMTVPEPADVVRIRRKFRCVIERAPLDVRRAIPTFGLTDAEYPLMKRMKDTFDPQGRLNPGRHVDGERN